MKKYLGVKKNESGEVKYDVDRPERILGERHCGKKCDKSRKCNLIDEETRTNIFTSFWKNMTWSEKKVYVVNLVEKRGIKRKTKVVQKVEGHVHMSIT